MLLEDLVKAIPADTSQRVSRTRDRFNQSVREAIRQETGLRFRPKSRAGDLQSTELISIPVRLVAGLPVALLRRDIEAERRMAALLAPWRRTLEQLVESSTATRVGVLPILAQSSIVEIPDSHLAKVAQFAEFLLKQVQAFDFAAWLLEVNEDVLGAYHYEVNSFLPPERLQSHIELYWGVIGLMAQVLGVTTESLTVVVLAHELAHAYSHRAADIDGRIWDATLFSKCGSALKEGLAQYYTATVCDRLAASIPEAKCAYSELLKHQPKDYRRHLPWIKKHKPEEVRFALVVARREGFMQAEDFDSVLDAARIRLRGKVEEEAEGG